MKTADLDTTKGMDFRNSKPRFVFFAYYTQKLTLIQAKNLEMEPINGTRNGTEPINYWPMQRIAAGVFVALWGMVSV